MIAQLKKINVVSAPGLYVEKGISEYQQQLHTLSTIAWQIAYTALWNGTSIGNAEQQETKKIIHDFIANSNDPRKAYIVLVQRIVLERMYRITHFCSAMPPPAKWFAPCNTKGFNRTSRWFQALEQARQSIPSYKIQLKVFGDAVHETINAPSRIRFHYWRNYFIEHNAQSLLNLFLSTLSDSRRVSDSRKVFRV